MGETSDLGKFGGVSYTPSCLPVKPVTNKVDPSTEEEQAKVIAKGKEDAAKMVNTSLKEEDGTLVPKTKEDLKKEDDATKEKLNVVTKAVTPKAPDQKEDKNAKK